MSSPIFFEIISYKTSEVVFKYTATSPTDGLCLMLFNQQQNYRTGMEYPAFFSAVEQDLLKPTFSAESISVLEGYESYVHTVKDPLSLKLGLEKLKKHIVLNGIVNEIPNNEQWPNSKLSTYFFETYALAEMIAVLQISIDMNCQIVFAISDC
jgi:hypothetical protein